MHRVQTTPGAPEYINLNMHVTKRHYLLLGVYYEAVEARALLVRR